MSEKIANLVQRRFLSVEEMVLESGLSDSTIRRWINSGVLAHAQPAGKHSRILIPADAFDRLSRTEDLAPAPMAKTPIEAPQPKPQRRGTTPKWRQQVPHLN
jgi:excisionase family DNA binding protein